MSMRDIPAAAKVVDHSPGNVGVGLMCDKRIPLPDESRDVVYCTSVLERTSNFKGTISEIARILEPGGKFILTVDIDLRGDLELGAEAFEKFQYCLAQKFSAYLPEKAIHPSDLLTFANSLFLHKEKSRYAQAKRIVRGALSGNLILSKPSICQYLAVYAFVFNRR